MHRVQQFFCSVLEICGNRFSRHGLSDTISTTKRMQTRAWPSKPNLAAAHRDIAGEWELNVIGLGYPRTGTMSLKHALEALLLGPCYHMIEVFDRPADSDFWLSLLDAGTDHADWSRVFEDFQSTADCPACYFWQPLWRDFPDAKFILTIRDSEEWYDSFRSTVFEAMIHPENAPDENHRNVQHMARRLILDTMFEGRFEDRKYAIENYEQHNQKVIDTLPPESLLIFNVAEGWDPLCGFLEVPVPKEPFPRSNTRLDFQKRFAVSP